MKFIPSMVIAALMLCWPLAKAHANLSPADAQFLTSCQVVQADIAIIPRLSQSTQDSITKLIQGKDCGKTGPLLATRAYYRKLSIDKPVPLPPAGWNIIYLTDDEFKNYVNILDNAPW